MLEDKKKKDVLVLLDFSSNPPPDQIGFFEKERGVIKAVTRHVNVVEDHTS